MIIFRVTSEPVLNSSGHTRDRYAQANSNLKMKRTLFYTVLFLTLAGVFIFEFMAYNSMVSLKYETKDIKDCISLVSGVNLCKTINLFHFLAVFSGVTFVILIVMKNKILNRKAST